MLREAIGDAKGFALDQEDKRTRAETGVSRSAVYRYESVTSDVPGLGRTVRFEAGYRGSANAAVKRTIRSMVPEYAKHKGQQNLAEDLRDFRDRTVGPSTHVCREAVQAPAGRTGARGAIAARLAACRGGGGAQADGERPEGPLPNP